MGFDGEQRHLNVTPDYAMPCVGKHGEWGSAGGIALRESLQRGSMGGVADLLKSMDVQGLVSSLHEAGFVVKPGLSERGWAVVYAGVLTDLGEAIDLRVDGFALNSSRRNRQLVPDAPVHTFAAKADSSIELNFSAEEFAGNIEAARVIQGVMRSESIAVDLMGDAAAIERASLLLIAGQAMELGIHGFGFDGIPGKYQVSLNMAEVLDLHRNAAQAVAEESARVGLGAWVAGKKVKDLSDWVPESVQRLLHGAISLPTAQLLVQAIDGGSIAEHAGEIGGHTCTHLLSELGLDVNALTIVEQAEQLGFAIKEPDRIRGKYFGQIVALDHRAALVKSTRTDVIELPFAELTKDQAKPRIGDSVRMSFKAGTLAVNVVERGGRESVGL